MIESTLQKLAENVIVFPHSKRFGPAATVEELKEMIVANKTEVIECFVEELTKEIFRITSDHGYNIDNATDIAYILICLKAILLRYENIYHPIQTFIDQTVNSDYIQPIEE
jgi:mannitol-1-phosphate/altronate dehydrogenase